MSPAVFSALSIVGAIACGANVVIASRSGGLPVNGAAAVMGLVIAVYFAARSHGWAP